MGLRTDQYDQLDRAGPDADRRLLGKYPGLVRDSFDPEERGRIRIYCPEAMGDEDNEENWLGWAEADAPIAGFDQGLMMVPPDPSWEARDVGAGNSPYNETRVWVEFRDGDVRRPVYSNGGSWLGESDLPHSKPKLVDSNTGGDETTAAPNRTSSTIPTNIVDRITGETAAGPEVREPQPATTAQYPFNYVFKTPAGAVVEFDNTPGGERIRLYHPAGTQWEINESGTMATKIAGKESVFVTGDTQKVVKGGAVAICEGLSHHQYNKSSNWIFGDDVLETVGKSKKTFITSGWNIEAGGQYRVQAGNVEVETVGAIKLIAGSAVNIGTDDYAVTSNTLEVSAITSKFQGQASCTVKCPTGVHLEANASATHPVYASLDIDSALAGVTAALTAAVVTMTTAIVAPTPPPVPIQPAAVAAALTAFATQISLIVSSLAGNKTPHLASRT